MQAGARNPVLLLDRNVEVQNNWHISTVTTTTAISATTTTTIDFVYTDYFSYINIILRYRPNPRRF